MSRQLFNDYASRFIRWDAEYSHRLRLHNQKGRLWAFAAFMAHSGDSWFWLAGLGIVWLTSGAVWRQRSVLLAISIVILALLVQGIKFVVRRRRPPGEWGSIYRNTDPHSFPSGHAARAAMLLVLTWGIAPGWFALVVTIWAPLVSLARIMTGLHYLSDVIAGVLLGVIFAGIMLAFYPWFIAAFPFLF